MEKTATKAPVIELSGVTVIRDGRPILEDVSWTVQSGERWAVLGLNGAGKSTLLRLVAGRLFPTAGSVRVFGQRFGKTPLWTLYPRIGWVSGALKDAFDAETPREIVAMGEGGDIRPPGRLSPEVLARAGEVLRALGLGSVMDRPFAQLSSGERQRTLIARAFFMRPELVVFDEPTSSLDLFAREALLQALDEQARASRGAIVYVTHHLDEVLPLFHRVLLIRRGRVFFAGPRDEALTETRLRAFYERAVRFVRDDERLYVYPR
ncbi:MAG: ATP-binding cassette domain-containing protein [Hydrogenibacillus sp.]|nr:ATP-binding cassette domain-containing protein [Hydrogenibacillus sp.]